MSHLLRPPCSPPMLRGVLEPATCLHPHMEAPLLAPCEATECHLRRDVTKCAKGCMGLLNWTTSACQTQANNIYLFIYWVLSTVCGGFPQSYHSHSQFTDVETGGKRWKNLHRVKDLVQAFWTTMQYCLHAETLGTSDVLPIWGVCTVNTAEWVRRGASCQHSSSTYSKTPGPSHICNEPDRLGGSLMLLPGPQQSDR